jgi:hypothetical protein
MCGRGIFVRGAQNNAVRDQRNLLLNGQSRIQAGGLRGRRYVIYTPILRSFSS